MASRQNVQLKLTQRNLFTEGKKRRTGKQTVRQKLTQLFAVKLEKTAGGFCETFQRRKGKIQSRSDHAPRIMTPIDEGRVAFNSILSLFPHLYITKDDRKDNYKNKTLPFNTPFRINEIKGIGFEVADEIPTRAGGAQQNSSLSP